jgi:hypothetical protein
LLQLDRDPTAARGQRTLSTASCAVDGAAAPLAEGSSTISRSITAVWLSSGFRSPSAALNRRRLSTAGIANCATAESPTLQSESEGASDTGEVVSKLRR